jgi:oxygen-dependent protoporphyrinogen oxidase
MKMTRSPQGAFVSLPGGTGELVEALAAALTPGVITTMARVTEIRRAGDYTLEWADGAVRSRTVVLCVPAYTAAGLLRAFDTGLAGACDSISYASTATVALGYRAEQVRHPMHGTGFVVPKAERRALLAGTWVTSKWPGRAPEGHVLLRAFLGGGRDPHRLERNDDTTLVQTATEELAELLEISGPPLFTRLTRWARQSPQYGLGHQARVATIEQRLKALPGLFLAGSGFRAIGIPDCIADGRATASTVAGFLKRSTAA